MSIVYVLLPFALLLGLGFTAAFIWSTSVGQYDDLDSPALGVLLPENTEEEKERRSK